MSWLPGLQLYRADPLAAVPYAANSWKKWDQFALMSLFNEHHLEMSTHQVPVQRVLEETWSFRYMTFAMGLLSVLSFGPW